MRVATIEDLRKEIWLRMRNTGYLVWETKEGKSIPIKDMTDTHLVNTFNMLERNKAKAEQEDWELHEAMGSMDPLEYYD